MTWPLFDGGVIRANIRVQDELTEQALINYQSTVLTALQNVEDALITYNKEQVRRTALTDAVRHSQRAFDLSNELYEKGLADFLSVLTSEQDLYSAQNQLASSQTQVAVDLVSLYKALGGGWEDTDTIPSTIDKADRVDTTGATEVAGTTDQDKQDNQAKSAK
jgi:outer membrane protein TolC